MKPFKIDRRRFLLNTSIALGSFGISPFVKAELLEKLVRQFLPEAAADDKPTVANYTVEIVMRAGFPLGSILFPSPGYAAANRAPNANIFCAASEIKPVATGGQPLLVAPIYQNNARMNNALEPFASNIAFSSAVSSVDGHTDLWAARRGGSPTGNGASPAVAFTATGAQTFIVNGVNWNFSPGEARNSLNGMPDLTTVMNGASFKSLFKKQRLTLNDNEVQAVTTAVNSLNKRMEERLKARLAQAKAAKQSGQTGSTLLTTDFSQTLNPSADMMTRYNIAGARPPLNPGSGANFGEALAYSLLGFQNGLIKASTILLSSTDWHGFQAMNNNDAQAQWGNYLAQRLGAFMTDLRNTPDPLSPGKTMFDTTLISLSSEFGRTIIVNNDNGDGGSNFFCFMGGMVKGGTFGDVSVPANATPRVNGFDLNSGATTVGMNPATPASVYKTHLQLLGVPANTISDQMGAMANEPPITCILKKV